MLSTGFKPSLYIACASSRSIYPSLSLSSSSHPLPPSPPLITHHTSQNHKSHPIKPTRDHFPHPYQKRDHLQERHVILCTRFLTWIRDTRTRKRKCTRGLFLKQVRRMKLINRWSFEDKVRWILSHGRYLFFFFFFYQ